MLVLILRRTTLIFIIWAILITTKILVLLGLNNLRLILLHVYGLWRLWHLLLAWQVVIWAIRVLALVMISRLSALLSINLLLLEVVNSWLLLLTSRLHEFLPSRAMSSLATVFKLWLRSFTSSPQHLIRCRLWTLHITDNIISTRWLLPYTLTRQQHDHLSRCIRIICLVVSTVL